MLKSWASFSLHIAVGHPAVMGTRWNGIELCGWYLYATWLHAPQGDASLLGFQDYQPVRLLYIYKDDEHISWSSSRMRTAITNLKI